MIPSLLGKKNATAATEFERHVLIVIEKSFLLQVHVDNGTEDEEEEVEEEA